MDIRCPICREPWDMDTIHEIVDEKFPPTKRFGDPGYDHETHYAPKYKQALALFRKEGCRAIPGNETASYCVRPDDSAEPDVVALAFELMGDDIDGVASMLDDAESIGLL